MEQGVYAERHEGHHDHPFVLIEGERVALGPLRRDLPYHQWLSDFSTTRTGGTARPMTEEQGVAWYERHTANEREAYFAIYERATWRPIGTTMLKDIDLDNRRAEFAIMIGEPDSRGKGYGTETTRLMLDYAFTARGLVNVMLIVNAYNLAGLRAYEKAGFREFGRRRQCRFMGGAMWDNIYMECIAAEFTSLVLSQVFVPDDVHRRGDRGG